jgi:hypothetical protein
VLVGAGPAETEHSTLVKCPLLGFTGGGFGIANLGLCRCNQGISKAKIRQLSHRMAEFKITEYLRARGLRQLVIDELVHLLPEKSPHFSNGFFYCAQDVMESERWFTWPEQGSFILVGQCPNGDGVAIDAQSKLGAVYYVAHELIGNGLSAKEVVVRIADSPTGYVQRLLKGSDPSDYWDAKRGYDEQSG